MTTTKTNLSPAAVREWLDKNAEDLPWTMLGICEGIGAAPGSERAQVHDAVRYCVIAGFLTRTDTKMGPVFQRTGEGMRRVVLTDGQRKERKRAADAKRIRIRAPRAPRPPRSVQARTAKVAIRAANTPASAPFKARERFETVEQFRARGGEVEILPTAWDWVAA